MEPAILDGIEGQMPADVLKDEAVDHVGTLEPIEAPLDEERPTCEVFEYYRGFADADRDEQDSSQAERGSEVAFECPSCHRVFPTANSACACCRARSARCTRAR